MRYLLSLQHDTWPSPILFCQPVSHHLIFPAHPLTLGSDITSLKSSLVNHTGWVTPLAPYISPFVAHSHSTEKSWSILWLLPACSYSSTWATSILRTNVASKSGAVSATQKMLDT